MANINFPASPVNNQQYTINGIYYTYDSSIGAWVTSLTNTPGLLVSDTPPLYPVNGTLWWNNIYGRLLIYYIDEDGTEQWVDALPTQVITLTALTNSINLVFGVANSAFSNANGTQSFAISAYNTANTAFANANGTHTVAISSFGIANTAFANANGTHSFAISAFTQANTANSNTVARTFSAKQTFQGTTSTLAAKLYNALEPITVTATSATGTINFDVTTQSILYYTSNAGGNFTVNVRGSSGTSLDSLMATGEAISLVFMNTNGATPYYQTGFQVDSGAITPKWQGGTAPTTGNASSIDLYTYTIVKTGSATFTVFAAQTQYK